MLFNIFGSSIITIIVMVGIGVVLDHFFGSKDQD